MERRIIQTADGSDTIEVEALGVCYHSRHCALNESMHVFIDSGLRYYKEQHPDSDIINVFEMGLGTGLNAALSCQYAAANKVHIHYHAVELHPITQDELNGLNYNNLLDDNELLENIHNADWGVETSITNELSLMKTKVELQAYKSPIKFDVVYYDAFAPRAQPELWTADIFKQVYGMMNEHGVLVTYCSKGDVRRAMLAAGFKVEKVKGPPGKREMLRAIK